MSYVMYRKSTDGSYSEHVDQFTMKIFCDKSEMLEWLAHEYFDYNDVTVVIKQGVGQGLIDFAEFYSVNHLVAYARDKWAVNVQVN